LLIVDMQRDFMPGGALPVPEGDTIIPKVNAYIGQFRMAGAPLFASRDWHPPETSHFQAQGGPWPPHCVQGTPGAEFHPDLKLPEEIVIVSKGMDPNEDAYSAFQARSLAEGRTLGEYLRARGVAHLYVLGLALDYCVKWSALDAVRQGLRATVLIDATRAVNVRPHDAEETIEMLVRAGIGLETIETLWVTCKACPEQSLATGATGGAATDEAIHACEAKTRDAEP
jgi:nicotinamidase/pyrazinamidase